MLTTQRACTSKDISHELLCYCHASIFTFVPDMYHV